MMCQCGVVQCGLVWEGRRMELGIDRRIGDGPACSIVLKNNILRLAQNGAFITQHGPDLSENMVCYLMNLPRN